MSKEKTANSSYLVAPSNERQLRILEMSPSLVSDTVHNKTRKESEGKLSRYLEEKINYLQADVSMEGKVRSEILESLN